tara:strand:+ start:298 stop:828 length:531 start_codon:yes stop_codon:yes gene_type:complete
MKIKELINEAGLLKSIAKGVGQAIYSPDKSKNIKQTAIQDFEHKGNSYRWLGDKWGVKVGAGRYEPAPKEMQQELNDLASGEGDTPGPSNINATLDSTTQYRFPHPLFRADDVDIIVRRDGWYLNKLPKSLRGQVQRDKETRLYRVKQPANIQKFNDYYDKAADQGYVVQEPADVL